jgi:hypothetical protein
MTYPLVLRCMTNPDLPFTLRASFCLLMQHLYVDVEPYKTITLVNYTRVWSDLEQKPQVGGLDDASMRDSRQARADLCKYVGYYIADNYSQSVNAITHNKLTLAVLLSCCPISRAHARELDPLLTGRWVCANRWWCS